MQRRRSLSEKRSHMFRFADDVALHGRVELLARRAGLQREFRIECIQPEKVSMRLARRRAGTVVANRTKIILALHRAVG